MDVSSMSAVERIARVLAGQRLSINADGDDPSAGDAVDAQWHDHVDDAVAVLKTLREPDQAMAAAGDPAMWERMVLAALEGQQARATTGHRSPEPVSGPDEEGEVPLGPDAIAGDRDAAWVHIDR